MDGIDLGGVRLLVNCSEPVRADSMDRLLDRFGGHGLRASALASCYAMAETTFAVTQTAPGCPPRRVLRPDSSVMAVSSGSPISGCAVRVVDGSGRDLPEGRVGEILIRSVSLFEGYRNQTARTVEALRDGWYRSGDLGFLDGGECFVVGRSKDVIVVAGRNLHPEDVEDAVGGVEGVLPGRVVAFGVEDEASGTERVHVVAETALTGRAERRRLRRAVIQAAMDADVTVARVHLAPLRWLIKSSAGKPARSENRARALRELATDDEQTEAP
jgi:acyl-CoA synthetase (AMP-forming)/AMP-acid ligase II